MNTFGIQWSEDTLNELLTAPSEALISDIAKIDGDIMVLGASGKMGPTVCLLAQNAIERAGLDKKIIAVSRFTDADAAAMLRSRGVVTVSCDVSDPAQLALLPDCRNVIYMVGRKFGTNGEEWRTWGTNTLVPAFVTSRFREASFVVFSTGNVYPRTDITSLGCNEDMPTGPIGEYAQSCLGRERVFEYAAKTYGTKVFLYRLNYAIDLRYGVLADVAGMVTSGRPVSLATPAFNCVWQGYAAEVAIRGLLHADNPVKIMNVTGPETLTVRKTAVKLADYLGRTITFADDAESDAMLMDASRCMETFGYPSVSPETMIRWQAEWILSGGRNLNKPTHFDERKGNF